MEEEKNNSKHVENKTNIRIKGFDMQNALGRQSILD